MTVRNDFRRNVGPYLYTVKELDDILLDLAHRGKKPVCILLGVLQYHRLKRDLNEPGILTHYRNIPIHRALRSSQLTVEAKKA